MMSSTAVNGSVAAKPALPAADRTALVHIPGDDGFPVIGDTFRFIADPLGYAEEMVRQYGLVHRTRVFGLRSVSLLGPDGLGFVLFNQSKLFSSMEG